MKNEIKECKTLKDCIEQIEMSNYECVGGVLKNNVGFLKLKELIEDTHEITEESMRGAMRKMKVESGWLYNFWNHQDGDFEKEWVFVPKEIK